jgi:hypothetical protein
MHCLGERPQGDCNLWLIVNRSLRSNFQVRHDIAIGGTVAATKSVVPGARGDPGAVGVPRAISLLPSFQSSEQTARAVWSAARRRSHAYAKDEEIDYRVRQPE